MAGELSPPVELQLGRTAAGPHGKGLLVVKQVLRSRALAGWPCLGNFCFDSDLRASAMAR